MRQSGLDGCPECRRPGPTVKLANHKRLYAWASGELTDADLEPGERRRLMVQVMRLIDED